jgi:hypothetical protein
LLYPGPKQQKKTKAPAKAKAPKPKAPPKAPHMHQQGHKDLKAMAKRYEHGFQGGKVAAMAKRKAEAEAKRKAEAEELKRKAAEVKVASPCKKQRLENSAVATIARDAAAEPGYAYMNFKGQQVGPFKVGKESDGSQLLIAPADMRAEEIPPGTRTYHRLQKRPASKGATCKDDNYAYGCDHGYLEGLVPYPGGYWKAGNWNLTLDNFPLICVGCNLPFTKTADGGKSCVVNETTKVVMCCPNAMNFIEHECKHALCNACYSKLLVALPGSPVKRNHKSRSLQMPGEAFNAAGNLIPDI